MDTLSGYIRIATLVKEWADRLEGDAGDLTPKVPALVDEMRAFSNELVAVVNVFQPILDEVAHVMDKSESVAASNNRVPVKVTLHRALTHDPFAMRVVDVDPLVETAMHFVLPKDGSSELVIVVGVHPLPPATDTTPEVFFHNGMPVTARELLGDDYPEDN